MAGHCTEISAHRGGAEDAPLASWEAYVTCVDTSAEYVELDIRRTADDVLVAHHDAWVEAPGRPLVRDLTYRQLCRMAGCRVPLVSELLEVIASHARGHLDLKEPGYERQVLDLATGILGVGGFLVSTPEEESARLIKDARPATPVALLLGRDLRRAPWRGRARVRYGEIRPLGRIRRSGADWVSMHHLIAASGVLNLCAREGLRTIVWTVNGDRAIDRLLADERVSVLVTDHPRHAARRRAALTAAGSAGRPC